MQERYNVNAYLCMLAIFAYSAITNRILQWVNTKNYKLSDW